MLNKKLINIDKLVGQITTLRNQNKKLKEAIDAFKRYDEERKEYYKFLIEDWQNSDSKEIIEKLQEKIRKYKRSNGELGRKLTALNGIKKYTEEEIKKYVSDYHKVIKVREYERQEDTIKSLRKQLKEITEELIKIKNKQ